LVDQLKQEIGQNLKRHRQQSSKDLRTGIKLVPPTIYGGAKSFVTTAIKTQPFRKDYLSDLYKSTRIRTELVTPRRQAELILNRCGELGLS
jgi:hypothetical protein